MSALKKGDLVKIGRKKDRYRIKQISPSGEGAVLIETVDVKPYATTYVNVDQLASVKADATTPATTPPVQHEYLVKLTDHLGTEALVQVKAVDDEEAGDNAATKAEADDPAGKPFTVTSVEPIPTP